MKFILIPFVALAICWGIKLFPLLKNQTLTWESILWRGFWAGTFPSNHASLLTSALTLVFLQTGLTAVSGFALVVTVLAFYVLLEDKKRQELFEFYLLKSNDKGLQLLSSEGKLREFNGHTPLDLLTGALIGVITSFILFPLL